MGRDAIGKIVECKLSPSVFGKSVGAVEVKTIDKTVGGDGAVVETSIDPVFVEVKGSKGF